MLETYKFVVMDHLVFLIPLIGPFKVCDFEFSKNPKLLNHDPTIPDSNFPAPLEKEEKPKNEMMDEEKPKQSKSKVSMIKHYWKSVTDSAKKGISKLTSSSSSVSPERKPKTPNVMYYDNESQIDSIEVIDTQKDDQDGTVCLLLITGKFCFGFANILAEMTITRTSFKINETTIPNFKSIISKNGDIRTMYCNVGNRKSSKQILEYNQNTIRLYEIDDGSKEVKLINFKDLEPSRYSSRLLVPRGRSSLLAYDGQYLTEIDKDSLTMKPISMLQIDCALLQISKSLGLAYLSSFDSITVVDLKGQLKSDNIQLNNLIIKTV